MFSILSSGAANYTAFVGSDAHIASIEDENFTKAL